ncbi:lipase [Marmoricola sp. Leaf446]|uniref:SGNH/GDSL hydrolase family protein n=1 Tax=Marmoricola sp. Leaf446 TaxID=1736379 RepID=UPI0006FE8B60|nr:SGNH/GDSL hydrolase family protein [Marmoricola sp. Leaf446]KQT91142.1 lipase [Marmoricola sp. Leaf446]
MRRRLAALSLSIAAAVSAGLVTTAPASTATTGTTPTPPSYVALGDSYSAASGVLPVSPTAPPQCLRSTRNYPAVIAAATARPVRDVTCGGADTTDYRESQYPGVAPQLDAVSSSTELVTMTIGGNDSGVFVGAITTCGTAGASTAGRGSPCRDRYGSSFEDTIRTTTYPALVRALQDVRAKAPDARVAILGYPWIVPSSGRCFPQLPIADGDVPYLRSLQATLNDAVARAAAATGATYVALDGVSEGHDACKPIGTRWVEPVVGTTNPVIVHPNALGERRMAEQTLAVLGLG